MSDFEVVVDTDDNVIGSKHWKEIQYQDIYRVSALWLSDSKTGEVLIAQRKWTKKNDPGKWSAAVAGTVEEDETYESNIIKEIEEEIGLVGLVVTAGPKTYSDDGRHRFFCQWFLASVDKTSVDIIIQESEVEAVKWVSTDWLTKDVQHNPGNYTPSTPNDLKALGLL